MNPCCPLCYSEKIYEIETVQVADLKKSYKRMIGDSISDEFVEIQSILFMHCENCDLKFFNPAITGSETFYGKLQKKFDWYYLDEKDEYDYAKKFINREDSVLEIGSGKGAFSRRIKSDNYIGLEFSTKAIDIAAKDNISILNESIQEHAVNNSNKYDVVCAFQVLEHVADIKSFIESSINCLKQNGILIFSVPSADSFVSLAPNGILNMPPHHISWWSDKALSNITDLFGLQLIDIYHEELADIHKQWYAYTIAMRAINNLLGRTQPLLDRTPKTKFLMIFAHIAGFFYKQGLDDKRISPRGHSVTAVYCKSKVHDNKKT